MTSYDDDRLAKEAPKSIKLALIPTCYALHNTFEDKVMRYADEKTSKSAPVQSK